MGYGVSCYECGKLAEYNIAGMIELRGILEAAQVGVRLRDGKMRAAPGMVNLSKMSANDGYRLTADECDVIGRAIWRYMQANLGRLSQDDIKYWDGDRQHYLHCARHGGAEVW